MTPFFVNLVLSSVEQRYIKTMRNAPTDSLIIALAYYPSLTCIFTLFSEGTVWNNTVQKRAPTKAPANYAAM